MPGTPKQPASYSSFQSAGVFDYAVFTVGAKVSTAINVAVQLQDANANNVLVPVHLKAYLSDNADGSTITATTPSGGVVIGTNGLILDTPVASKVFNCVVNNLTGKIDLTITQSSTHTFYLVIVGPMGNLFVSGPIAF